MKSPRYRYYMLGLLTFISASNFLDRQFLSIALQDIKQDLLLSDSQLGLLTGIGFAFFYAVMGIPLARWVDRGNRVTIVALTTTLFGAVVALCGMAMSFLQLFIYRVVVAIGEAGVAPAANSLIPDYFSRPERPRAVSVYLLGATLSGVMGYLGGGALNELYGWRTTFFILGLPGVFLGVIAWFTLREPRLKEIPQQPNNTPVANASSLAGVANFSLTEVLTTLWRKRTFKHIVVAWVISNFFGFGVSVWAPSFLIRNHAMASSDIGLAMALIYGLSGALGAYLGGELATRFAANDEKRQFLAMGILMVASTMASVVAYTSSYKAIALTFMGLSYFAFALTGAPLLAIIQSLIHDRMRAMAIAIVYLLANLIGMGLGPMVAGMLSDGLAASFGDQSLQYALIILSPGYLFAVWHLWKASRTVADDLAVLELAPVPAKTVFTKETA